MTPTFEFTTYIYRGRNEREIEIDVEYTATPIVPAVLYGDYPQPAEGGEVEVLSVKHNGAPFALTAEEDARVYDQACDRADDDLKQHRIDSAEDWCAEMERGA